MRYEVRQQDEKRIDLREFEAYRRFVQKHWTAVRHKLKVSDSSPRAIIDAATPYFGFPLLL